MLISFNYVSAEAAAKMYNEPVMEELYTGYLHKSPPPTALNKTTKSWKRRFFVLSKTREDSYYLTYHENEKRDKTLGEIDLSKISLLFIGPEAHQKWDWIQKNFKCFLSSVLFLKVEDDTLKQAREYFLIGENRDEVEGLHTAIDKDKKFRSRSVPVSALDLKYKSWSTSELTSPQQYNHHGNPLKYSEPPIPITVIEEKDAKEGKQDEPPRDNNEYMTMGSVQMVLEGGQQEDDTACKKKTETHTHGEKEILTQEEGKPCVSQSRQIQDSRGDQILATGGVKNIQKCFKTLSKNEAELLVQQYPSIFLNPGHHT
ncbi:pleckstrin homology domain-containing family S member 1-like isoform X2 [Carassius auratus]|uniref:Pleckstrin homology domain-containing family S member 1-like isoform X2 n=1 Tax=Carassius auratus TaxID=7957 RepID=A0A6P6N9W3_CARAU|nr:pleckstrin homology domain-containing family S member 1-like isoform X2 [Carassius auratus]